MRVIPHGVIVVLLICGTGCVRHVLRHDGGSEQLGTDPPPGKVAVNVVSADDSLRWEVIAGREVACVTPCTRWFDAKQGLLLRSQEGDVAELPDFGAEAVHARRALVVAEGTWYGKRVNGIVFTTIGGMGVVTAITLSAVGCSDPERAGMCTAGLITGAAAVPLTAVALWMLIDSGPKAHVLPVFRSGRGAGRKRSEVLILPGPGGIVGVF